MKNRQKFKKSKNVISKKKEEVIHPNLIVFPKYILQDTEHFIFHNFLVFKR